MPISAFPSRTLSLSALFGRAARIEVPAFQRPYSWTVKESGQLLEDIAAAAADDDPARNCGYFLGTVLMLCKAPAHLIGDKPPGAEVDCEVIDGQQRLATVTILAAVLRELDDAPMSPRLDCLLSTARSGGGGHRLRLRASEQAFLESHVLAPGACSEMPDETRLNASELAILATREHFMSELAHLPLLERQRLARYLLDSCHLVVIATDEIDRAHRMFVVLNGRGLPLRREDILKAEVSQSLPLERSDDLLARWDRVATRLGPRFEDLFGHIRTIHGETRPQIIAAIRSIVAARGGGEAFVGLDLEPLGEALATVASPWDSDSDLPMSIRRRLVYLNRLAGTEWVPAAMLALGFAPSDPARAETLIAGIDRLAHVVRIMCMSGGKRHMRFNALLRAIVDGGGEAALAGPLQLGRDDLRVVQFNLRDIHVRAPSVSKLLLLRLSDEMTGLLPAHEPAEFSVEHVLPLRLPANSPWRQVFPDPDVRAACTHSLGNLALLTPKQNERARNEDFARKRAVYDSPEIGRPLLEITRDVLAYENWGPDEVRAREARLLALIGRMWDLPLAATAQDVASEAQDRPVARRQRASGAA